MICVSMGLGLLHTKVRDGTSKGKVERHFRTLKERWLYALDIKSIESLEQFNGMLKDYMRNYNTTFHRGIDSTPMNRYLNSQYKLQTPASQEWLDECFLNRITRKVRKDSTVSIDKASYDVPMQFISSKIEIRFLPGDMDSAYIFFDKKTLSDTQD
ncbi:Mu transposase C-terminal domain-containing protein [Butyrivibrio sp. AE3003]|uniref:Mu transposase C-terminal domain-containing protein n=1 Tax=Butyrivibrio sp. AE3003 TaxID=1496721 RepID=UPI00068C3872|nr:Mu transposase C-terminal domain-containing protein [Butyrivibrio sp. AE3003]